MAMQQTHSQWRGQYLRLLQPMGMPLSSAAHLTLQLPIWRQRE